MQSPNPTPNQTEDATYYREILHTLIQQGAAIATQIHDRATAATPTDENRPNADPTIAFDRIARAIRRCVALARHIAAHPTQPVRTSAQDPAKQAANRAQLIRGVEDAIHRQRRTNDADPLYAEFAERLEDPALEFDLATRSIPEIIEEIARDLGVAVQGRSYVYKRRTPADIAALHKRAAFHLVPNAPAPAPQATTPAPQATNPPHPTPS